MMKGCSTEEKASPIKWEAFSFFGEGVIKSGIKSMPPYPSDCTDVSNSSRRAEFFRSGKESVDKHQEQKKIRSFLLIVFDKAQEIDISTSKWENVGIRGKKWESWNDHTFEGSRSIVSTPKGA
jgi:hypothetical protein